MEKAFDKWIGHEAPQLDEQAVHVWRVGLESPQAMDFDGADLLSSDETQRAAAFHFDVDRRHYVACRAALRILLGKYVGGAPGELAFSYNDYGKPEMAARPSLHFNVSHSSGWALIAIAKRHRVGVDLERVRPLDNIDGLARDCFSPRELATFSELAKSEKLPGFFNAWTRKEAFIKACGEGLSRPLKDFDVSLSPEQPPRLQQIRGDSAAARRWSMFALAPIPEFVGAVVVERAGASLRCFDLRS